MTAPPGGEPVGSLLDEALKLARSLADQAQDGARQAAGSPDADTAHRPESCDYCPLCQLIAIVRSARPDIAENLTTALTALTLAARGVVESWTSRPPAGAPESGDEGPQDDDVKDGPWE